MLRRTGKQWQRAAGINPDDIVIHSKALMPPMEDALDSTVFLSKLLGPVILALGIFIVIYPNRVARMGREVLDSEALLLISGVITLPAGLAVVLTHNLWVRDWPVLITLFGWIMILAGLARIMLPDVMRSVGGAMLEKPVFFAVPGLLMAALGAFLTYQGYFG